MADKVTATEAVCRRYTRTNPEFVDSIISYAIRSWKEALANGDTLILDGIGEIRPVSRKLGDQHTRFREAVGKDPLRSMFTHVFKFTPAERLKKRMKKAMRS